MQKTAELKVLPVSVLKPAEYNPRKKLKAGDKEYEKIKNSIEEFGFADPLVVNSDMTIIGGHQRLTVAMDLGYTEVPCAVVDIDKVREKALNIALNKITGAWDDTLLAELLEDIQNSNFDLGKTGFDRCGNRTGCVWFLRGWYVAAVLFHCRKECEQRGSGTFRNDY